MPFHLYAAYVAATLALLLVPGPTVTMIIANSLKFGTRAGLLNIAGTQLGVALMLGILMLSLETVIALVGTWFDWIRIGGAIYLAWLGLGMLRAKAQPDGPPVAAEPMRRAGIGFFWQGFAVILANPKILLFFGAFIPQFIDRSRPAWPQIGLLSITFMTLATLCDGAYAVLAGTAGGWLTGGRRANLERISGVILLCGAVWLSLLRR